MHSRAHIETNKLTRVGMHVTKAWQNTYKAVQVSLRQQQ